MLKARKIQLRKEIGELLLRISDEDVKRQSANVTEQVRKFGNPLGHEYSEIIV